jgi:hypothetical protein
VRFVDEARRQQLQVVRWLSASDGALRFIHEGKSHWLRPDAVVDVHYQGRLRRLYIEWDRGTMRATAIKEKLHVYAAFHSSVGSDQAAPLILVITTSPTRENVLWQELSASFRELQADPTRTLTSVSSLVDRLGPFGRVWRNQTPNQRSQLSDILTACKERG